ncbi:MogA/MoaB family molybdenum cofactor biosynthesis protein [Loigolactobacillus iwatensis]|uniref:MogA/MoaB family molybdenum cofactor biosynthesis protein n=1 Tax=Loigolactobacillus iwatensis TaxID=1267156 RepID=UPI000F7DF5E5|nr:MogA/MoaB family molybdenum cofactor biosynthesis protein [Loigolactobacillus iwatensis]
MTTAAILTISDTRSLASDKSGQYISQALAEQEVKMAKRLVVKDDVVEIQSAFLQLEQLKIDLLITNGGTGIAKRDVTFPALEPLLSVPIPGFGEAFRSLSYSEIGSHALASRAMAGFNTREQLCFVLPGSTNACKTALNQLILPEFSHLLFERRK